MIKSLVVASALALAAFAAPLSYAGYGDVYSAAFQGITFTFTESALSGKQLTFEIAGTPSGDWTGVNYFGAFNLKDLGLDFTSVTAIANGDGATNLAGKNSQLSAANTDCGSTTGEKGAICFDIAPDVSLGLLPFDFTYVIDFSSALNLTAKGPGLQVVFTKVQNGAKVGSLYSQNVGRVPEPNSSSLMLLGLAVIGIAMWTRRRNRILVTA